MTFATSILKFFFQKKFFAQNCVIRKDHRLFFRFAISPHEELCIGNGNFFLFFEKAKNFLYRHILKLSIFLHQLI